MNPNELHQRLLSSLMTVCCKVGVFRIKTKTIDQYQMLVEFLAKQCLYTSLNNFYVYTLKPSWIIAGLYLSG